MGSSLEIMKTINISISDDVANLLSSFSGWVPKVSDPSSTPDEETGALPVIDNPVTTEMHLQGVITNFIINHVKREAQKKAVANINSMHSRILNTVERGEFSDDLLSGDNSSLTSYIAQQLGTLTD